LPPAIAGGFAPLMRPKAEQYSNIASDAKAIARLRQKPGFWHGFSD
jgi:hypothetical protein